MNSAVQEITRRPVAGKMEAHVLNISPEKAAEILEYAAPNRKPSRRHIETMAEDMRAGRWIVTGQPIIFDASGRLIDGQNRMHAVILSGVTVPMTVLSGGAEIDPEAFAAIDIGQVRRAHTVLELSGHHSATKQAAALRLFWYGKHGYLCSAFRPTLTNPMVLELAQEMVGLDEAVRTTYNLSRAYGRIYAPGAAAGFLMLFREYDHDIAEVFWQSVYEGIGLRSTSPIYMLRTVLIRNSSAQHKFSDRYRNAITIKAWNAFAAGEKIKLLRWGKNEKAPAIYGILAEEPSNEQS